MSGIVAVELTKMWSAQAGLRPITFTVESGELVVVRGRSGSGKSTLLALVAGLCVPDAGSLSVDGVVPSFDMPWTDVAFVPQALALAVELSVRENISDAAPLVSDAHLHEMMERLDLHEFAGRCIDEISMGQQQRAAVARACNASPRVLLVDEPTSFQDGHHATAVIAELARLAREGAAVLVATHDDAVVRAADRILELADDVR
ncbi:MAG TPA: ATP-binding cassette domain-containing protein [Ilumatobacteraceae bacterium]|nr:ATP-binding cassette domain-containing protein [Ilumatobacteraceae bacterium]